MTRLKYLLAIQSARDAGFIHFAAALVVLMRRDYPEAAK